MASKDKSDKIPDILINVDDHKPGVRIVDFQKQPGGPPMKVYISDDGTVQIVQTTEFGVDAVQFSMRTLAALMKVLEIDWNKDHSGNFTLYPQRWVGEEV